jgi:hypothetical protein
MSPLVAAIVGLLGSIVQAVISVTSWLREKQLVESGVANQQLSDMKDAIDEVQQAVAARASAAATAPTTGVPVDGDPYAPYRD